MFDLSQKVAIVTGASSGIGRGIALSLANQGATVVIGARRKDKLDALAAEIKSRGRQCLAVPFDSLQKESIVSLVDTTMKAFGHIDILVNNAGVLDYTPFLEMSEAVWDRVIDTNLKGYFLMSQQVANAMVKNPSTHGGRIINIASIASGGAGVGYPMLSHYCASKGGVIALTEAMAAELGVHNILVNAIGPGGIESEMTTGITKEQQAGMNTRLSVKRLGKPEEIGALVVYLASDESSYTTGATMYVDGGYLAN
jgi:NAD(P)-dependent dehydrogenase (short-subunit alcohol dehydrogenase family)